MIGISVKEAAQLEYISESAVKKRIKNTGIKGKDFHYIDSCTGQGGKKLEINLEFLSEQAQAAYHNKNGEFQTVINTDYTYSTIKQKESGEIRSRAISEFRKFKAQAKKNGIKSETQIKDMFIDKWNLENPDFQRTRKTLYSWLSKTKQGNVEKLIDRRGGYNRGQSSIQKYYQDFFLSWYLQQSKPPFDVCLRYTQAEANKNGDSIKGKKAFKNLIKNLNPAIIIREREGKKAFEDKCMPTMPRDYSKLDPNDLWVSDHHLWDVFVRIPDEKGGWKPVRPWGSYWMDMRTRKVMSSFIRVESPNSDIVLLSFGLATKNCGDDEKNCGIPKKVYMDNGKDYKARDLFYPEGHKSKQDIANEKIIKDGISEDELKKSYNSLAGNLQMDVTYAIPFNARAKPIERLFETFENNFGKLYPSYAGSNAKNRPEDLKDLDIMSMITLEEFIAHHKCYVEDIYNNSPHSGDSMNKKSPNYWYETIDFTVRNMSKEALYFTLMRTAKPRKVGKEGITFNKDRYLNSEYQHFVGKEVIAKYNPTEPEILYVFDLNENFLFIANRREKYGFELTDKDYEKANHEKKLARSAALNGYKKNDDIRTTEAIGNLLVTYADSLDKTEITDKTVIEPIRNEQIEDAVRRIHSTSLDRNYDDVLKAQDKAKKNATDIQAKLKDNFMNKMLKHANDTAKKQA